MATWTSDELTRLGDVDEVQIAPRRRDGTLRKPVTIWDVRLGDDLYVRAVNGPGAAWFRAAQERHEGRIQADGAGRDVTFEEVGPDLAGQIDAAYRAKYQRYPANIVDSIVTPRAREATFRLVPRPASA